jgi:hypothetical protein
MNGVSWQFWDSRNDRAYGCARGLAGPRHDPDESAVKVGTIFTPHPDGAYAYFAPGEQTGHTAYVMSHYLEYVKDYRHWLLRPFHAA